MSGDSEDRCGVFPLVLSHDKFQSLCAWHDEQYILKEEGKQTLSRKEIDKRFLKAMLIQAEALDSWSYKLRAYAYYGIARAAGGIFWKWI